jgi:hypothetical protein
MSQDKKIFFLAWVMMSHHGRYLYCRADGVDALIEDYFYDVSRRRSTFFMLFFLYFFPFYFYFFILLQGTRKENKKRAQYELN